MANNEAHKIDYYKNGNIQRERYYFNDKLHNENGPAEIWYYNNGKINQEFWCNNGKFHNENEPVIIKYNRNGSIRDKDYYLNGEFVMTYKEVEKYINSTKPIKVRTINKLKILYNVCKTRNLENKVEEIGSILLLKTFQNDI